MPETPSTTPGDPSVSRPARHYGNDWLTVLAMFVVFLFHCARFFDLEDWHVKNAVTSSGASLFVGFVGQWMMPLFFVLSGMSSTYSLKARAGGRYLANRFRRLVIPFLFASLVVLIPVQVWIERVSHGQFSGSFADFYPHYFEGFYAFGGNFAWMGLHLWYLEFLFLFTLLTLPLFALLTRPGPLAALGGLARRLSAPPHRAAAILLLALPIFVVELLVNLQPETIGMRAFGGWSLLTYLTFFALGFVTACDEGFRTAMVRSRFLALALAALLSTLMFLTPVDLSAMDPTRRYLLITLVRSCNSWFWLVALLGFAGRHLNLTSRRLDYLREAVLPFYILHQTVIVIAGFGLAGWQAGVGIKYLALAATSFSAVVLIYEFIVRRAALLRFLFGMKLRKTAG